MIIPKSVYNDERGREKLYEGVRIFAGAVKSTLGPAGKTVLIEGSNFPGGYIATKDGVTVADNLRFEDPVHDMVAVMLRQAAQKTAKSAGDGTTTSVVLTEAILNAYKKHYDPELGISTVDVTRGIQAICDRMVEELDKMAIPVSGDMLRHVATISTNNDPELGELVSDLFSEVDVVTIEESKDASTYSNVIRGLHVDKGYSSRYMITNPRTEECVLENAYVLLYDQEIHRLESLFGFLQTIISENASLLIIGNLSIEAMATLNANIMQGKGKFKAAAIAPPDFGYLKAEKMEDLAYVLGGTYFSEETGDDISQVSIGHLGRARKVTISANETVIEPMVDTAIRSEERIASIQELMEKADEHGKRDLESRLKSVKGSYGIIHVGAPTAIELREKKDRIEDAVCAVRAAKEEGILPGGGKAILEAFSCASGLDDIKNICFDIMTDVVEEPLRQMLVNAGLSSDDISQAVHAVVLSEPDLGYNIKTGQYCNLIEEGVIDPAKVTKNALINAVSVANTILNTSCIVVNMREASIQK
jgi:chaperonin GroEL